MFHCRFGSGHPNVCVACEYDALPEIGHACGHNLIAELGVAVGLGVKAFLESKGGGTPGTITVMGTPAEEGAGGKIMLIERGAFKDIDIAVMAHPGPSEIAKPTCLASYSLDVTFKGKAAHAAAFPWEGVNALDAAVLGYTNVSALRQQMKPTWRVHGIVTDGGVKPNIIPEKAVMSYIVRAETVKEMRHFDEKVRKCFTGASQATGCSCEMKQTDPAYEDVQSNELLARMYADHMQALGITDVQWVGDFPGSTDMGNVSYVVPSIHPIYKVADGIGNHTREFADIVNGIAAHEKTITVAKALSNTCIDAICGGEELLKKVQDAFNKQ